MYERHEPVSEQHGVPNHIAWILFWRDESNEEQGHDQICTRELLSNVRVVRRQRGM